MFVILHWNSTYTIRDSKAFLFDIQTKYCHYSDSMKCYQIPSLLYGWQLPSPVSPRSKSTRDPALPSRSPLKHSRVSAAARLISSSRIQWPFLTAWANVPYSGAHRGQSWGIQPSAFTHRYMDCFGIWPFFVNWLCRGWGGIFFRSLPPQRQRPWQSHRLGSVAGSGSAWQPTPPTAPAARQLHNRIRNISLSLWHSCQYTLIYHCLLFLIHYHLISPAAP